MAGRQFSLFGLVFGRHLLGVAACGFCRLELIILYRNELRAERGDLFLGGRADVCCRDHAAKAAGSGDGLQAGNASPHDKHFCRGDRAGGGHHHRHGASIDLRAFNYGTIAGEV